MAYVGGNCSASTDSQDDKADCDNFNGGLGNPASVYIIVSEDDDGDGDEYFAGTVNLNGTFTAAASIAGEDKFPSKIFFNVYNGQGGSLLQRNEIHTSCSAPVVLGEQFGGLLLQGVVYENGTNCGPPPTPQVCPEPIIEFQQGQICAGDPIVFEAPDLGFPCLVYV